MSSSLEIHGKKFLNIKEAAERSGYARDYVGKLAREQKIIGHQIGRQWFIDMSSLESYQQKADLEQKSRQQKLREERKRERELAQAKLQTTTKQSRVQKGGIRSRVGGVAVLCFGLLFGWILQTTSMPDSLSQKQIASLSQNNLFPNSEEQFAIVTQDETKAVPLEVINFSEESVSLRVLDGDGQGVMVLPNEASEKFTETEVAELFSDPVRIVTDNEGRQYIVRTKADGTEERLPFAVVPVTNQTTP